MDGRATRQKEGGPWITSEGPTLLSSLDFYIKKFLSYLSLFKAPHLYSNQYREYKKFPKGDHTFKDFLEIRS